MERYTGWFVGSIALIASLASCDQPAATDTADPATTERASATEKRSGEMRYVEVTDEKVTKGKALYASCVGCHGEDGGGKVGQAPRLGSETFLAAASDDYLFRTIKDGRTGTTMIAWGNTYKDEDIEAIIAYLRKTFPSEPVKLDESPLKGSADAGGKLFGEICAACHGVQGAGYMETANGTGIGRKGFVEAASDGFIRYLAKNGKSQTAMRPMSGARTSVANLSDEEIDSVIAYLRASAW